MFHPPLGGGSIGRHPSGQNRSDQRKDPTLRERRRGSKLDEEEVEGNEMRWRRRKRMWKGTEGKCRGIRGRGAVRRKMCRGMRKGWRGITRRYLGMERRRR